MPQETFLSSYFNFIDFYKGRKTVYHFSRSKQIWTYLCSDTRLIQATGRMSQRCLGALLEIQHIAVDVLDIIRFRSLWASIAACVFSQLRSYNVAGILQWRNRGVVLGDVVLFYTSSCCCGRFYAYLERTSHDTELLYLIQEIEITTSAFFPHEHSYWGYTCVANDCLQFMSTANMWMQVDTRLRRALMR